MNNIDIGLSTEQLKGSVTILNQLLADEFTLYVKARKYHWNVEGLQFHDLHKFFETVYTELDEIVDEVAERTRSLGSFPIASLKEFSKQTRVLEDEKNELKSTEMIKNLLLDFEHLIKELRTNINKVQDEFEDVGTADFLTGLMEKHEKTAWMLRSILA